MKYVKICGRPVPADSCLFFRENPMKFVTVCPDGSVVYEGQVMSLRRVTYELSGTVCKNIRSRWIFPVKA